MNSSFYFAFQYTRVGLRMHVENTTVEDEGFYSCVVENYYGNIFYTAEAHIVGKIMYHKTYYHFWLHWDPWQYLLKLDLYDKKNLQIN